ncbi:hypothetical protein BDN71DRAFT_1454730 [Pleurotus eryngii]|uniref:Uncharacterized protein n=1 Tax=Pleurotus eryngii TaxID=5323 RepID=A0A9P5ZPW8_PLEER|nr:hypothetical protein BDN71DRAFT_1454730 [Pleurotus eryngii]
MLLLWSPLSVSLPAAKHMQELCPASSGFRLIFWPSTSDTCARKRRPRERGRADVWSSDASLCSMLISPLHPNDFASTAQLATQLDPHAQATRKAKVLRFQLAIWQLCATVAGSMCPRSVRKRGGKKGGIERCTLTGTGQFVIPVLFAHHVEVKVLSGNLRSRAVRAHRKRIAGLTLGQHCQRPVPFLPQVDEFTHRSASVPPQYLHSSPSSTSRSTPARLNTFDVLSAGVYLHPITSQTDQDPVELRVRSFPAGFRLVGWENSGRRVSDGCSAGTWVLRRRKGGYRQEVGGLEISSTRADTSRASATRVTRSSYPAYLRGHNQLYSSASQ